MTVLLRSCLNLEHLGNNQLKIAKSDKKFCVSTVCGRKGITENRLIRERLYLRQKEILIPKDFYVSGNEGMEGEKILGDSKLPLFESMFHICIENISQKNWFTEKLIDPIVRKSIPIYIGCPNIDSYFKYGWNNSCK